MFFIPQNKNVYVNVFLIKISKKWAEVDVPQQKGETRYCVD